VGPRGAAADIPARARVATRCQRGCGTAPSHMLDGDRVHITDLGHANRHKPDVIMTQIRDMSERS